MNLNKIMWFFFLMDVDVWSGVLFEELSASEQLDKSRKLCTESLFITMTCQDSLEHYKLSKQHQLSFVSFRS